MTKNVMFLFLFTIAQASSCLGCGSLHAFINCMTMAANLGCGNGMGTSGKYANGE